MICAYKHTSDLVALRELFYDSPTPSSLAAAVANVQLLHARGRIPHGIDSTANIVSVQLQDQQEGEPAVLRNAYAMALVRFVNGILDPLQQGGYAMALLALATTINLPYSFVELRHAATHEQLPLLAVLRRMAAAALRWLYEKYWVLVGDDCSSDITSTVAEPTPCSTLLRQYRKARKRADAVGEHVGRLVRVAEDVLRNGEFLRALVLPDALLKLRNFPVATTIYKPLTDALPPPFVVRLVFALATENIDPACASHWLRELVPQALRGPFPVVLNQTFDTAEALSASLEASLALLDADSEVAQTVRSALGAKKRAFAMPPLLDELLGLEVLALQPVLSVLSVEGSVEPERPAKRARHELVFEACLQWRPTPLGQAPR